MNKYILLVISWLKNNWIVVALMFAMVFFYYQNHLQQSQIEEYQRMAENEYSRHINDIAELRRINEEERLAQEEINRRYEESINHLVETYNRRLADLEERTTIRRRNFIRDTNRNPTEMANRVRERLGWQE